MADDGADGAAAFAEWLTSEGRAANTVAAYRRDVAAYLRWADGPGAGTANPTAAYVEHVRATRAPSSAARAVVALRMFHRWRGELPMPELAGVPLPAAPEDELVVPEEGVSRLLEAVAGESVDRRRDAVAVGLLYFAGLKASEAIQLDTADVDVTALVVDRYGARARTLPLVPVLHHALARWLDAHGRGRLQPDSSALLLNRRGQRLTRQGLWLLTAAVGRRARLADKLSPNDLRRACAAHLVGRGVPSSQVSALLGHSRGPVPSSEMLKQMGWGEL